MQPFPYQLELIEQAKKVINQHKIVYLSMEQRTGKCIVSIKVAESLEGQNVGIITKRKAVDGWLKVLSEVDKNKLYFISSYQKCSELPPCDIIILDESHSNIAGVPKLSVSAAKVKSVCAFKPIIYASATPYIQGAFQMYHQLHMSSYNPYEENNYYKWFNEYADKDMDGSLPTVYVRQGLKVINYQAVNRDKAIDKIKHLFVSVRRTEAGFENEPEDVVHYIDLSEEAKKAYDTLLKDRILRFNV